MFMAEAVLGLNKEFARLDKTLNDLTKSVEDSAIHLTDALTQSIDQSVGITNKVQEFITALESQAAEMTAQIKELVLKNRDLVTENTRLRYVTLGLAIATFLAAVFTAWMAYSTQALADEAKLNMARDVGDKRFQELRQALEKEKSIYIDQLIQKDLELANLRKQNNLRKER
jgi:cell division protein FtsL